MKPSAVLSSSVRAASCCSLVSVGPRARQVHRHGVPVGQGLGGERAGIDQAIDHAWTDAGCLGQARLDPDQPVLGRVEHAGARRSHALRLSTRQPHAVTRRRRIEGAAGAHHHAQHHAGRGQRVACHPVGEVERDARQRRHVVDQLDDLAQFLAVDLWRRLALRARPHRGEIIDRPERHDHELPRLDRHALGHEIVVRRRQRERQQHRDRHAALFQPRVWVWSLPWPGVTRWLTGG